ncbi:predicted protein [Chaetomium globosum CBS 148.51]|uniref:Uncharacterized protein n=1 Tax=Chaetomium globosum (strain ATCC 6205 / CBS 148.51 / DSM 1962 / NBRC 6347 / NRRL 1970) TaxID=306901 RepID=Q2GY28_CHAGB|nr:uncharacterized protein CHGG_07126 [Chaetomium globosum CBS 148.51]EAQ85873.1 predicted protein [Chaetomium globosum CBS 148.51]
MPKRWRAGCEWVRRLRNNLPDMLTVRALLPGSRDKPVGPSRPQDGQSTVGFQKATNGAVKDGQARDSS